MVRLPKKQALTFLRNNSLRRLAHNAEDAPDLARRALAAGIVLAPGNVFSLSPTAGSFMRFNVAQSADERIFATLDHAMRR